MVPAARLPPLATAMSCSARRCRNAPSPATSSAGAATMLSAQAIGPGEVASTAPAKLMAELATNVFANDIAIHPWLVRRAPTDAEAAAALAQTILAPQFAERM